MQNYGTCNDSQTSLSTYFKDQIQAFQQCDHLSENCLASSKYFYLGLLPNQFVTYTSMQEASHFPNQGLDALSRSNKLQLGTLWSAMIEAVTTQDLICDFFQLISNASPFNFAMTF